MLFSDHPSAQSRPTTPGSDVASVQANLATLSLADRKEMKGIRFHEMAGSLTNYLVDLNFAKFLIQSNELKRDILSGNATNVTLIYRLCGADTLEFTGQVESGPSRNTTGSPVVNLYQRFAIILLQNSGLQHDIMTENIEDIHLILHPGDRIQVSVTNRTQANQHSAIRDMGSR